MSMSMVVPETEDEIMAFQRLFFKKMIEMEHYRRTLNDEKKRFELQREKLERERRDFHRQKEADARFRAQEERLLLMKQKVLEDELKKLADEKQYLERQREFYSRVRQYQQKQEPVRPEKCEVSGALFFSGVKNEHALKKRYKDLIKIYHPDNAGGDTEALQEINREYDRLCVTFSAG